MKQYFAFLLLSAMIIISCSNDDSILDSEPTNYSLQFNGVNNYVEIPFTEKHDLFEDFSIESWVKYDSVAIGTILSKATQANEYDTLSSYSIGFEKSNYNKVVFSTMIGWRYNDNINLPHTELEHKAISTLAIIPKRWHHITVVYTEVDNSKKIYIDGKITYSETNTEDVTYFGRPLYFGATKLKSGKIIYPFRGIIDEIRIWQKALTPDEIFANMTKKLIGNENGLVGLYHFDEGYGFNIKDDSPYRVNGIVKGAIWVKNYDLYK